MDNSFLPPVNKILFIILITYISSNIQGIPIGSDVITL